MNEVNQQRIREFIAELTQLTRKHRIAIAGCGCCSSPYLITENVNPFGEYGVNSDTDGLSWRTDESK